jgi:hypothetical protein
MHELSDGEGAPGKMRGRREREDTHRVGLIPRHHRACNQHVGWHLRIRRQSQLTLIHLSSMLLDTWQDIRPRKKFFSPVCGWNAES